MTVPTSISTSSLSSSSSTSEVNIPHEFLCPITQEIMKNPLMSRYGQTYERDAILTWLSKHNNVCPLTRQVLNVTDLIRHRALASRIDEWRQQQQKLQSDNGDEHCVADEEDDDFPIVLLTCLKTDLPLSSPDHNPKKSLQDQPQTSVTPEGVTSQRRQGQRGRRLLRLMGSTR